MPETKWHKCTNNTINNGVETIPEEDTIMQGSQDTDLDIELDDGYIDYGTEDFNTNEDAITDEEVDSMGSQIFDDLKVYRNDLNRPRIVKVIAENVSSNLSNQEQKSIEFVSLLNEKNVSKHGKEAIFKFINQYLEENNADISMN